MATLQVPLVRQGLQHRIDGDRVAIRRIRRISRARTKEKYVSRPLDRPATDRLGPRETTDQLATARLSGPLNDSSTWARGAGKLAERHCMLPVLGRADAVMTSKRTVLMRIFTQKQNSSRASGRPSQGAGTG